MARIIIISDCPSFGVRLVTKQDITGESLDGNSTKEFQHFQQALDAAEEYRKVWSALNMEMIVLDLDDLTAFPV